MDDNVDVGFVPMECVKDGYSGEQSFYTKKWKDIKKGYTHFQNGDIGIAKISPCFENKKSTIFHDLPNGYGAGTTELTILRPLIVNTRFYLYIFKSAWYISEGSKNFKGNVGQQRVSKDIFTSLFLPLPPLAEQKRIVAEVEKWFALIDDLEANKQDLQAAIRQVRAKVLDLAIHGKLVPQDPNDEPAIALLRRINPHYTPSDTSHYQNIPFDIPTSWQWVQLGIVFQLINGDRGNNYPSKEKLQESGAHPFISAINIKDGSISKDGLLYVTQEQYDALGSGKLKLNDIVLCIRGSLGKSAIYPFDSGAIASSLVILRNSKNVADTEFVFDYIHSPLFSANVERNNNGTAQPNLSAKSVAGFLFPLPPLAEQKRIVSEIERIFGVLGTIEENIR